jgi:hypothetical protein
MADGTSIHRASETIPPGAPAGTIIASGSATGPAAEETSEAEIVAFLEMIDHEVALVLGEADDA